MAALLRDFLVYSPLLNTKECGGIHRKIAQDSFLQGITLVFTPKDHVASSALLHSLSFLF